MKTFVPVPVLRNINDLLKALAELEKDHVCKLNVVKNTDSQVDYKCDCGKTVEIKLTIK